MSQDMLPVEVPVSERTVHRIITPDEDALIGHVRGWCHNSQICGLCAAERLIRTATQEKEAWQERAAKASWASARSQAMTDSIITGDRLDTTPPRTVRR